MSEEVGAQPKSAERFEELFPEYRELVQLKEPTEHERILRRAILNVISDNEREKANLLRAEKASLRILNLVLDVAAMVVSERPDDRTKFHELLVAAKAIVDEMRPGGSSTAESSA